MLFMIIKYKLLGINFVFRNIKRQRKRYYNKITFFSVFLSERFYDTNRITSSMLQTVVSPELYQETVIYLRVSK
jgi:hypothetical protein